MVSYRHIALVLLVLAPSMANAATDNVTQQRQADIQRLLTTNPLDYATDIRSNCATGKQRAATERGRTAGLTEIPDVADACVTALTRIGREGTLGYVRDTRYATTTPAIAFDNGFVTAYLKRDAIPDNLPTMATLKPAAERCLDQRENDTNLCYSVGYAYGVRASNGEVVRVQ